MTKHLVRFLVDQTEGGPHQRSRIVACVDGAAALLTHLRDVRFTVAIEHLGTRPIAGLLAEKPPSIVAALVELRAAEPSELDAAEWESLRRIEDLVAGAVTHQGAPSIRDLFEAVWADPSSNEPRHVLADRLQEAGDPRGDFIALQLARDGKKRRASFEETSLLEQHGFAWRGALRCEHIERAKFRRGFLDEIYFGHKPTIRFPEYARSWNGLGSESEWTTVERLSLWPNALIHSCGLLNSRRLISLRHVADVGVEDFIAMRPVDPLQWTSFAIDRPRTGAWRKMGVRDRLQELPSMMPQLRTLTMPNLGPAILDAVATGLHLESLAIPGPARDLRTLLQIAKQAGISVVHLLGPANLSFDLATRRASLWFSPPMGVNPMTAAMELAAILGALSVPTFELAVPKRSRAHGQATADPLLPRHLELYQGELDLEPLWSRLASQGIPCKVVPEQAFGWSLSPNAKL